MKIKYLFAFLLIMSTYVIANDSTSWNDSVVIDDSIGWNDSTVIGDSTGWNDSTVIGDSTGWNDSTVIGDSTGWNDSTIIGDSSGWNDTTIIDDSTGWNDSTIIGDSSGWNDTTVIGDTTTWNDSTIIGDSTSWIDTNYYDDSTDFIYDSINDIGLKFFWNDSSNIVVDSVDIVFSDSTNIDWIFEDNIAGKLIKIIDLHLSDKYNDILDSTWISINYEKDEVIDFNDDSLLLVYYDENTESWKSVDSKNDTSRKAISGQVPSTSRVALAGKNGTTAINGINGINNTITGISISGRNIKFSLSESANISLTLFNMRGRNVLTLFSGNKTKGIYSISNKKLNNIAAGNYIVSLKVNNQIRSSKLFKINK